MRIDEGGSFRNVIAIHLQLLGQFRRILARRNRCIVESLRQNAFFACIIGIVGFFIQFLVRPVSLLDHPALAALDETDQQRHVLAFHPLQLFERLGGVHL